MDRTVDPDQGRHRARSSSRFKGVAAAVAAALLAGAGTAWLTRPSDAASSVETRSDTSLSSAPAPGGPGASGTSPIQPEASGSTAGSPGAVPSLGARPATAGPEASAPVPDRMTIRRLGIEMPVVAVGVARDGEMALPKTPADVGWYRYGPRPGDAVGSTVLAAHLDMPGYGVGPIAAVEELRDGDVITVRSGPVTRRYAVTSVQTIRKTTLDLAGLFARDGPPRLHIVTCGGNFDREERRYDENVVVTAVPTT